MVQLALLVLTVLPDLKAQLA